MDSDTRMKMLMELNGREIVHVCQVSTEMMKICKNERYTPLWRKKILEEFNVDYQGKNGYEEYKKLSILQNTTLYTVVYELGCAIEAVATFYNYEDAVKMLWKHAQYNGGYTYQQINEKLSLDDEIRFDRDTVFSIIKNKTVFKKALTDKEEKEFQKQKNYLNLEAILLKYSILKEKMEEKDKRLFINNFLFRTMEMPPEDSASVIDEELGEIMDSIQKYFKGSKEQLKNLEKELRSYYVDSILYTPEETERLKEILSHDVED